MLLPAGSRGGEARAVSLLASSGARAQGRRARGAAAYGRRGPAMGLAVLEGQRMDMAIGRAVAAKDGGHKESSRRQM